MTTVYLYGGEGTFAGTGEFQWNSPAIGSTHKLILFLTQEVTEPQEQLAMDELAKYGFRDVQVGAGKPIAAEVLNEPQMKVFQKHYEGCTCGRQLNCLVSVDQKMRPPNPSFNWTPNGAR